MACPRCKSLNPPGSWSCLNCTETLPRSAGAAVSAGVPGSMLPQQAPEPAADDGLILLKLGAGLLILGV